jgi:hypothetical protein
VYFGVFIHSLLDLQNLFGFKEDLSFLFCSIGGQRGVELAFADAVALSY